MGNPSLGFVDLISNSSTFKGILSSNLLNSLIFLKSSSGFSGTESFNFSPLTVIIVSSPIILWKTSQVLFPGTSTLISKVFSSGLK